MKEGVLLALAELADALVTLVGGDEVVVVFVVVVVGHPIKLSPF